VSVLAAGETFQQVAPAFAGTTELTGVTNINNGKII
jgi:hypothetical protein